MLTPMFIGSLVVQILITAVLLHALASALPDMESDGILSALGVVLLMQVVSIPIGMVTSPLLAMIGGGAAVVFVAGCLLTAITVAVACAIVPGMKCGPFGALLAGVLIQAVRYGVGLLADLARSPAQT